MAAGVVETDVNRVYSKGTRLFVARASAPTAFTRVLGVTAIDGANLKRTGDVDATELAPDPDSLPSGTIAENYYYQNLEPGTKAVDPIKFSCNMERATYGVLNAMFNGDEIGVWKITFKNGDVFGPFPAYVAELGNAVDENTLVKADLTIQPTGSVQYVSSGSGP